MIFFSIELNWYVQVRRMNEERLTQNILEWCPPGRRRIIKGRPRNSWIQKITTGMREKEINMEWIDRGEWRRKIKLKAQKDVKTLIICM